MAKIDKNLTAENPEIRDTARLDENRTIAFKDMTAGIYHKAKMLNSSKNGMYFETDSSLNPGAKIYLGIAHSLNVSFTDEFECKLAEIVWRKKLVRSHYNYGYGVKFISADEAKKQKCGDQTRVIDSRKHPRKPYFKSVLCAANNQIIKGTTQNISLSGMFLKTDEKMNRPGFSGDQVN